MNIFLRCYELYDLVREVAGISGDILEVGVWRGGTGAILAAAARRWKPDAHIWLCDTFSGIVKAGPLDAVYKGGEHGETSVEIVTKLISHLGLENHKIKILKGVFPEDTCHFIGNRPISLCHIDVDVYKSGVDIVRWVMPRMPRGCDGV